MVKIEYLYKCLAISPALHKESTEKTHLIPSESPQSLQGSNSLSLLLVANTQELNYSFPPEE